MRTFGSRQSNELIRSSRLALAELEDLLGSGVVLGHGVRSSG
jgi:hypothetical protein